jgi:hypothetical protein
MERGGTSRSGDRASSARGKETLSDGGRVSEGEGRGGKFGGWNRGGLGLRLGSPLGHRGFASP